MADLERRYSAVTSKKAKLQGQLEAKKQELVALNEEIQAAGYDPKNLKKEKERVERSLAQELDAFERDLQEVETAIASFEAK
jgi:chromosome segregation ATPase